jgi:hypothetical protein
MNTQCCLAQCRDLRNELEFAERHLSKLPETHWPSVYQYLREVKELQCVLLYETVHRATAEQVKHIHRLTHQTLELGKLFAHRVADDD